MCVTNASMSDSDDALKEQVAKDNTYFKALLDLVPPAAYFSVEEKNELLGNVDSDDDDDEDEAMSSWKRKKHKRTRGMMNPLSTMSVSQITELQLKGETLVVPSLKAKHSRKELGGEVAVNGQGMSYTDAVEAKHESKKKSRTAKALKNKGKEIEKREARLAELHARLKVKLEEMKARKNSGKPVTSQEQKRLRRQEKKVSSKMKTNNTINKGAKNKEQKEKRMNLAEGLRSPPRNQILNENGDPVKSKFDFSMFSVGNDKSRSSDLHGKDYKRLLEKVEKRNEKLQELKEKDPEKGKKLEEKLAWQATMSRAKGEKVKDDPQMLKKSLKRKEKMKAQRKKKWEGREQKVDEMKDKRQQKRQANLDKRKNDKGDKKRKKMIKKGRIIPGF